MTTDEHGQPSPASQLPVPDDDGPRATLARYREAARRLEALIDADAAPPSGTLAEIQARAAGRLDGLRRFLAQLGNPHYAVPVVHVAGTSGKGSTAATAAALLAAAGHRVGLHTSPYLQVATEKIQIDGALLAPDRFAELAERTLADAERWQRTPGGERLGYGEVGFALAARAFAEAKLDVAVIEVGAGGRFDLTNLVRPAVAVITTVGLDHQATLGDTIEAIAWHKAGILKPGAPAVSGVTDSVAQAVIRGEAARLGVPLIEVGEGRTFAIPPAEQPPGATVFHEIADSASPAVRYTTALPGWFQAANAAVALAAVRALAALGPGPTVAEAQRAVRSARLPGRMEWMPVRSDPQVLLDGAHNPQKMAALAAALDALGERDWSAAQPVVLLGLLHGKEIAGIVGTLAPRAGGVVVTRPRVLGKRAAEPELVAAAVLGTGFRGPLLVEPDPSTALDAALALAAEESRSVLVTGSLYLVGELRERWYPASAILLEQTSWPTARPHPAGSPPPAPAPRL